MAPPDERLDRAPLTLLHLVALAVCTTGFAFDLQEIAMGGVLAAVFSSAPRMVGATQLSVLLASVYVGAAIGAPLLGRWADRHGRRRALTAAMLWLCATSAAAACSDDIGSLTACRALAGLALGAFPPLVLTYLTDLLPPRLRGPLVLLSVACAALGAPAGVFFVKWVAANGLVAEPWRCGLLLGAVGAGVTALLFRFVPESPRWLQSVGRSTEAEAVMHRFQASKLVWAGRSPGEPSARPAPARALPVTAPASRRAFASVALLFFLGALPTVGFPLLSGAVLAQKGFALDDTLFYVAASMLGPCFGTLLAAAVVDRIERRRLLACCALVMGFSAGVFALAIAPDAVLLSSLVFQITMSVYVTTLNLYGSESFPTAARAGSLSSAWALNRIGAAMAPLVMLPLLRSFGPAAMVAAITVTLLGSIAVLLMLAPRGMQQQPLR